MSIIIHVDGDLVTHDTDWDIVGAATRFDCINNGISTPNDSEYLRDQSVLDGTGVNNFTLETTPVDQVTAIGVTCRARVVRLTGVSTLNPGIVVYIYKNNQTLLVGEVSWQDDEITEGASFVNTTTKTISGLSLTQSEVDGLTTVITGAIGGIAVTGNLDLSEVDFELTLADVSTSELKHKMSSGLAVPMR